LIESVRFNSREILFEDIQNIVRNKKVLTILHRTIPYILLIFSLIKMEIIFLPVPFWEQGDGISIKQANKHCHR
jgi:hypothetical protein